jgi:hypothetical protein
MVVAVGDMARVARRFRGSPRGAVAARRGGASKTWSCHGCWRLSAGVATEGRGMHKIWLGVVVLAVEAVVLVWLVGAHVLQWFSSGLAGR